jgi:hypothetical protein
MGVCILLTPLLLLSIPYCCFDVKPFRWLSDKSGDVVIYLSSLSKFLKAIAVKEIPMPGELGITFIDGRAWPVKVVGWAKGTRFFSYLHCISHYNHPMFIKNWPEELVLFREAPKMVMASIRRDWDYPITLDMQTEQDWWDRYSFERTTDALQAIMIKNIPDS